MGFIKQLFGKKESSCCDVKIEEAPKQDSKSCCDVKFEEVNYNERNDKGE